jgi:hypothetical protein
MSTRSSIAIKHGDRIKSIYCHSDGYLEYNGRVLLEHYSDSVKVNKLIAMGDVSMLGREIGEKINFNDDLSYDGNNTAEQCRFYSRDRGEEGVEYKSFAGEADFIDYYDGCGCEFYYLYDHGVWYYSQGREFTPLHESVKVKELVNA